MGTTRSLKKHRTLDMKLGYQVEDLRFPAQGINPPGNAGDPDISTTTGLFLFDAAATEMFTVLVQLPHGWQEDSPVVPHIHWRKTTSAAGDVAWKCEYIKMPIGEAAGSTFTSLGIVTDPVDGTPDNDTAREHLITSWGDLEMIGLQISDCILFKVSRIGGDASDTYGADAEMLEFDLHVQLNSIGSDGDFHKG